MLRGLIIVCLFGLVEPVFATEDGIAFTSVSSRHTVSKTVERVKATLMDNGLKVFAEIDHEANARGAGMTLRPTYLLIFGDPAVGTRLMTECAQSVGLDLPLKYLVWEDEDGTVWISHNKWTLLDMRHEFNVCGDMLKNIEVKLEAMAELAAH